VDINKLYHEAANGDRKAEEVLFRELTERFHLFLQQRLMDGQAREDLVQDTLLTISQKYQGLEIRSSFAAWAYRVMENKLRDYYRLRRNRSGRFERLDDSVGERATYPMDPVFKARVLRCLEKTARSNPRYARVLALVYQGYGAKEISRAMNLTRNTCYILLSRARARLREYMQEEESDE
jgi:RNA polymerase sigma-70 factor (ECF subfamily)